MEIIQTFDPKELQEIIRLFDLDLSTQMTNEELIAILQQHKKTLIDYLYSLIKKQQDSLDYFTKQISSYNDVAQEQIKFNEHFNTFCEKLEHVIKSHSK